MAVLEFQGWAVLKLAVSKPSRVLLSCKGVTAAFLHIAGSANATAALTQFNGDVYSTGTVATLFSLNKSTEHRVYVFVRAKVSTQFSCFAQPGSAESAPTLRVASVFAAPDVLYEPRPKGGRVVRTGGLLLGNVLGLLITSAFGSPQQAIESLHCSVEGGAVASVDQPAITTGLRMNAGSGVIALPCRIELSETSTLACDGGGPSVRVVVSAAGCVRQLAAGPCVDVQSPTVEHELRCRRSEQSAVMTYLDHDGSAASASLVLPISLPRKRKEGSAATATPSYPVLLTLHGTGVTGSGQADAYKQKPQGADDYEFGVIGLWVLAPDRFGAHNWQGWGQRSAFAALQALSVLTAAGGILPAADSSRVLFAGHSMGGAGAWFAATAAPDLAIAAAPAAGWLVKASYVS